MLPEPQRVLWPELAAIPRRYVLYGGTAIALRLAHRPSVDFDFFAHDPIDHRELDALTLFRGAVVVQEGPNERTVLLDRGGPIKLSMFGGIDFGRVGVPDHTDDDVLRVASLLDLGGTKIKALLQRIEAKDYRDVVALLDADISLPSILGAAQTLFGAAFNHLVAQKALCYFEGGDLDTLEASIRERLLLEAGRDVVVQAIASRSPRLD
ncbi:MAG: nucleotidyl transferase AbiEii/AbiGii toxin family protein [Deltaproteobacteria bacterium]|nr:nucleotidyl transferase AbiEii/AbiGii toxin family protein [Deltaproteobacteria bacterium]